VEKARFEDRLQVEFQIAEPTPCQRVPEFLLLSLVEHAIQCGMAIGPAPLRVVVSARCLGGWLCIEVSSTAAGAAVETGDDPILERLQRRLALSYKADDYRLTSSQSAAWTSVTIEIAVDKQAGP
jgi:LytS/YehU family sensor histidine kinase